MNVRGTIALVSLLAVFGCDKASPIATGSLSGTARYAGQSDHSGISVSAGGFSTTTDAAGNYALSALPVGQYQVMAYAPASVERAIAVNATVNAGANTAPAIVFTPPVATGTLSGTAKYAGKTDHSGISITTGGYSAITAADGSYSFAALPVGTYTVTAIAASSAERTLTTTAIVNAGANTASAITFTPAQALAGQLTLMGQPLAGATVSLDTGATTTTDASGVYSFATPSPGQHRLSFTSGTNTDAIPVVLYSPDTGGSVPAYYTNQLFQLRPFDLQNAKRMTSLNLRSPARTVNLAPILSPDGLFYLYGLSNDQGTTSLYLGSTAGGDPALVSDDVDTANRPKFAPASGHLAFVRKIVGPNSPADDRYELWAITIDAGSTPLVNKDNAKRLSLNIQPTAGWEYSPQTTATPSLYFVETGSLREVTVDNTGINGWAGVEWFAVAQKTGRVVFKQTAQTGPPATTHRIVSVAADATTQSSPTIFYESGSTAFNAVFLGFSPDQTRFAYSVTAATGVTAGLKMAATAGTPAPILIAPETNPACFSFNADGTRIVWDRATGAVDNLRTTPVPNAAVDVNVRGYLGATATRPSKIWTLYDYPSPSPSPCPTFTDDGRIWLFYYDTSVYNQKLALVPADASDAVPPPAADVFFTDGGSSTTDDLYQVQFARRSVVFTRYLWSNYTTSSLTAWVKGLSSALPQKFDTGAVGRYYSNGGLMALQASGDSALWWKWDQSTGANSAHWIGLTSSTPTLNRIATYCQSTTAPMSSTQATALMWDQAQPGGTARVSVVDMATGVTKKLMGEASSAATLGSVGTTSRFVGLRLNTPVPYDFQDGFYIADVP